jgi:hypothetical protein
MDGTMNKKYDRIPLSESNVSLKLAEIQRRFSERETDSEKFGSLSLEEPVPSHDHSNPYDYG